MAGKIVFINQATGYITIDIINAFAGHYDKISLIAGSIRVQDVELDKKVRLSKIIKYNRGNPRKKLISWFIATVQIFFLLLFKYRKYEIFYITVPPTAYLLSLILRNKFTILIFDVYPDLLKIYKINESSFIYRLWTQCNQKLFIKAHRIFTIGDGMANLLSSYMPRKQVRIIPLWTGLNNVNPVLKHNNLWLKNLGFNNKFIVQYSGNIGYTHNVEIIVELAIQFRRDDRIHFIIIGRGERYNDIQHLINNNDLDNCTLLPFQPDDVLKFSLSAADIGVVLLDEKTAHVSLPSKIYNLQAVGIPILGISPQDSELSRHLKEYKNGKCFNQSDIKGMAKFISELSNNPSDLSLLSENSHKAAGFFTKDNADIYYRNYVS